MLKAIKLVKLSLFLGIFSVTFVLWHHQSREISYLKLEELLKQQKWIEADRETIKIIDKILLVSVDRQFFWGYSRIDLFGQERFRVIAGRYLDCKDFTEIDSLWQTHSNNKYGFSTQSKILMSLINTSKNNESSVFLYKNEFYQKVGWNDWNSQAPSGSALERSNIKETGSLPFFFG